MAFQKDVKKKSHEAGGEAINEHQEAVMIMENRYQPKKDQMEEGEKYFPIRNSQICPERVAGH